MHVVVGEGEGAGGEEEVNNVGILGLLGNSRCVIMSVCVYACVCDLVCVCV